MTVAKYRQSLRSAVRGYWSGVINRSQFINAMDSAIRRNITRAWITGASECDIQQADFTIEEKAALAQFIFSQSTFVTGFADDIESGSKANGGQLGVFNGRIEMWVNRWNEAKTKAAAMACADKKKIWVVGPTEHCNTCKGLDGRVYRYSVWLANALPQSSSLACKGYRCQCKLEDTDQPITKGRFPRRLLAESYEKSNTLV